MRPSTVRTFAAGMATATLLILGVGLATHDSGDGLADCATPVSRYSGPVGR